MERVLLQYGIPKDAECVPYGSGHINRTYLVKNGGRRYILQRINTSVFHDVEALMHNIDRIGSYLAERDPDPRHVLRPIMTCEKKLYTASEDGCWRLYPYIEDSICLETAETPEDLRLSGEGFGLFQKALAGFPADELKETIPHFHDTPDRVRKLEHAIREDRCQRAGSVRREIDFALSRTERAGIMVRMQNSGDLPVRVTHNDTKLNNVLLDAKTRRPLCVIDLDTVMPGLAGNDFGDSVRFGAATAAEDERDLNKVHFSGELFEAYAEGFCGACADTLTPEEIDTLPLAAQLMTYECGIRFLTDYLEGDTYFHTEREGQNLDRCRTQFRLVSEMERCEDEMLRVVRRVCSSEGGRK